MRPCPCAPMPLPFGLTQRTHSSTHPSIHPIAATRLIIASSRRRRIRTADNLDSTCRGQARPGQAIVTDLCLRTARRTGHPGPGRLAWGPGPDREGKDYLRHLAPHAHCLHGGGGGGGGGGGRGQGGLLLAHAPLPTKSSRRAPPRPAPPILRCNVAKLRDTSKI